MEKVERLVTTPESQTKLTHDVYELLVQEKRRRRELEEQLEAAQTALGDISAVRLPTGNAVGRDDLRGCHQARVAMQTIARKALASIPTSRPQ